MAGGVMEAIARRTPDISSSDAANCVYFAASFAERRAIPAAVLACIVIKEKRLAIGGRSKDARIGMKNFAIEFFELQVAGDIGAKRAERVRKRRSVETGMKFLGDRAAADHFAAFENQRLEAALRQIKRGDESVVTAADETTRCPMGMISSCSPFERERTFRAPSTP